MDSIAEVIESGDAAPGTLRFKYLNDQGYFREQDNESNIISLSGIEKKAEILVNLLIKFNLNKSGLIRDKIINTLNEIEKEEYGILKQYIY